MLSRHRAPLAALAAVTLVTTCPASLVTTCPAGKAAQGVVGRPAACCVRSVQAEGSPTTLGTQAVPGMLQLAWQVAKQR